MRDEIRYEFDDSALARSRRRRTDPGQLRAEAVAVQSQLDELTDRGGRCSEEVDVMTSKSDVRVRRVYDAPAGHDGTRVLVDRIWPRGLTKARADLTEWCKQVAPSTALRRWYGHDPAKFEEFASRYRAELEEPERATAFQHLRELAENRPLTLLTATKQADISEAAVLADLLRH